MDIGGCSRELPERDESGTTPGKKRRAFLMLRVSDRKQANKYGPSAQRAEAYEGGKECPIPLEFSPDREAFWTETASSWNRKQFTIEMARRLEEFHRGEWDVLVFPRVDRETRFLAGSFEALSQMLRAGVPIYFAKHHLVLRQGDSEAFDTYFDLVKDARAYIKVLKSNTAGGRAQAMLAGRIPTGWGPKGLTGYDWKDGRFVKNHVAPAVEFMLRRYLEGYSESSIMFQLKKEGFLTKAERPFAQSTVSKVLHHARFYAGFVKYKDKEFSGLIEPIITEEEAERIKERLSRNTTWRTAYGRAHWWTGRVFCGICQRRVSVSKSHGCRCNGRDNRLPEPCAAPCLGFDAFQSALSDSLRLTLSHPEVMFEQICEQVDGWEKEMSFLAGELRDKKGRLAKIDHRLERLSRQHEMGILDEVQLMERTSEIARDRKEMQVRIRELEDILSSPAPWNLGRDDSLVSECLDAFELHEGSPEHNFMSAVTTIVTDWVGDLGMPGTIPEEETWQRISERSNLRVSVYPPEEDELDGQQLKATLRITGEFSPNAGLELVGSGIQAATASTRSSRHGPQMHLLTYED